MKCIKKRLSEKRKQGKCLMLMCMCPKCYDRSGAAFGVLDSISKVVKSKRRRVRHES